jgi:hypothetical protein
MHSNNGGKLLDDRRLLPLRMTSNVTLLSTDKLQVWNQRTYKTKMDSRHGKGCSRWEEFRSTCLDFDSMKVPSSDVHANIGREGLSILLTTR